MLVDLNKYRFPITQETLQTLEPFKHMILEHKSQVELLQPWIPQEMTRELHSVISELYSKMVSLEMKATDHERYLDMRQCVEDLREAVEKQVHQTKDNSEELVDKYKVCQCLLIQFPLITCLCGEARAKLQMISADLHPSQLTAEQQRLKQNEENLNSLELTLHNNLNIIEENLLKDLDLESEKKATQAFLLQTQQKLQTLSVLEPNDTAIIREYQKVLSLKKMVESRMRALEVIEQKKGEKQGSGSKDLMALKDAVLSEFPGDVEATLLPPQGPAGLCSDRLEETQEALAALQEQFQTNVDHLKSQFGLHLHLCPEKVQQLLEDVLSQLLVKLSTLQAKGHIQLESLSRCAESHRNYTHCHDEIMASVTSAESSLSQFTSEKVTCLTDCTDQEAKLRVRNTFLLCDIEFPPFTLITITSYKPTADVTRLEQALSEEVESLLRRLEELQEWCPEQSCRGGREAAVAAVWRRVSRLHRRTQELAARSKERIAEWSDITNSVEKATTVLEQVEAELPKGLGLKASTEEIHDLLQSWEQYQDRLDCEHRALSALELRAARLLGVPAHLEEAPPTPLCQQLQAMQARYDSVKKSSTEGLEAARMELEDRDKVRDELQGIRVWVEAADELLSEMEASNSTQELQEVHSQLYSQKALLQHVVESMKKYGDIYKLVPPDIDNQLTEVKWSLQQVEVKMGQAVKRSGPVHKLGAKLSEIHAGLSSVQKKLDQRSPTVVEAKVIQKRVWDDLDMWHSSLAMLEGAIHDLEKPQDVLSLTERLVEVQQLHSQLSKQAEQRTTLLSKIHTWLQEHQEMISSSKSWMTEAQSWLAAPCTYTTAKCLSSHVHALQVVLNDSEQIRTTLQGFGSVLEEMSLLIDVTTLQEQLLDADQQVAEVQDSFTAPLSQLEHAADEVEAIESEVRRMENDVAEIKTLLSSPETFPSPREESLKVVEQKIQTMRRTVAEIQKCKPGLCLPENAEETLTVFTVVDDLQTLLLELEKKVPAVYIQQPPTPVQAKALSAEEASSQSKPLKSTSEAAEGQIQIVHVEEDVLRRSGATLQTVEQTSPEQRQTWSPDAAQRGHQAVLRAEEAAETKDSEQLRVEEGGGGVFWWLWDAFLGASPEEPAAVIAQETEAASKQRTEETEGDRQDVEGPTDSAEASSSEALSKPLGTVRTQALPTSMELMQGQRGLAWRGDDSHPEGLKTHTTVHSESTHTSAQDTHTLTEQSCTPCDFRDERSQSSEVDSGVWSLETSHSLKAHAPSVASAEQAEASEPQAALTSVSTAQHQDLTEGLHPAAAAPGLEEPRPGGLQPGPGPCPGEGVLHVCLERVSQLELWLQEAQRAAGSSTMQDSMEQQLLTCQEMFLELEQKVATLSSLGRFTDLQLQDELGAVGSQQQEEAVAVELLSSKLELLKANLVTFQQLLQDRQGEERTPAHRETQEQIQKSTPQSERHHESKLKRSSSVQEIFSSPRNKLLRQSSLQQQKELEQQLSEQRGLTQAIARQGSRARLHSHESEELQPWSPPAEAGVEEDGAQTRRRRWDELHRRLLAVEESWLLPPSEVELLLLLLLLLLLKRHFVVSLVTDSSRRRSDGTAGRMIGTQNLKELRSLISRVRELGESAAELQSQTFSVDESHQTLDESLFHVLHGASLCLSSINHLLHSTAETTTHEEAELKLQQLQSLSAELETLHSELASQGSKVSGLLGSQGGRRCLDDLSRVLPVVQAAVRSREKQLKKLQEESAQRQSRLNQLHAAFTSNQPTVHQIINQFNGTLGLDEQLQAVAEMQETLQQQVEQVNSLLEEAEQHHLSAPFTHQATQLQVELHSSLGGVQGRCEELRSSVELQQQYERLVHSLQELLAVGPERLTQRPDAELQSRAELQQQLIGHMKFFQFLGQHFKILQYLTCRLPESALQRWDGVVMGLQEGVTRLQQQALERGTRMQETLQWEEDSAWLDSLLREIETSFPMMHEAGDSEEQLCVYQVICPGCSCFSD
ncbi:hypothetical protein INR49_006550 [Caranx melampygus]|nr:hypothetical protein INR49_006550 [Caranx melampygus]